jgi:B9 domain-containing protein 1
MVDATPALSGGFIVNVNGTIESGHFGDADNLYCRYSLHYGHDWSVLGGLDTGLSQTAQKNPMSVTSFSSVVWNFPIDVAFRSTNIYGWPRLAISVFGVDFLGRDVIRGYGMSC